MLSNAAPGLPNRCWDWTAAGVIGMDKPLCSVCVANYNGLATLAACLDSVLRQEGGLPVEIIVHDDASSDGSVAFVREHYPGVRLIESRENVGFCVANNRMAAVATGECLLLLNNDAALWPDALVTLWATARALARPAILGLPQYEWETGALLDIGSLFDPFFNPIPNLDRERGEVGMVIGACLWIPRALWEELGGFPEWFGSIGEDLYLCCRARLAGYPVRGIGRSGFRHRVGGSFGGGKVAAGRLATTLRRRALSERNKTFVMIICQPALLLAVLLPLHLVLIHLEGLLVAAMKRDGAIWRKIYAPLAPRLRVEWDRLRAERSIVQSTRTLTLAAWLAPFRWLPWKLRMLFRHGLPEVKN